MRIESPSAACGLRLTLRLWALVVTIWLVQTAIFLPPLMVVEVSVGAALAELPDEGVADGDVALILLENLRPILQPLLIAVVISFLLLWQWSVVWRAGIVAWQLWAGGGPVSLSQIVGLGLTWWWRYLRLSLTALAMVSGLLIVLWIPLSMLLESAHADMAEGRTVTLIAIGLVLSPLAVIVGWATSLRAAWLLGRPDRRSAVGAWLRAFVETLRRPAGSFGVLFMWGVPLVAMQALPIALGLSAEGLHNGIAGHLVVHATGVIAIAFRVALYTSYAPTSGFVEQGDGADPST